MVKMPQEDGKEVLMAVLQRRGRFNTEKMKLESYPGCCQVTVHGKLNEGEEIMTGLRRETEEELGLFFAETYFSLCGHYVGTIIHKTSDESVITFGTVMPIDLLRGIRLGPDSGGLVYVNEKRINDQRIIFEIGKDDKDMVPDAMKKYGPSEAATIAMFPDEVEAVRKAFEVFGQK